MQAMGETGSQYWQMASASLISLTNSALLFDILDSHCLEAVSRITLNTPDDACHKDAVMG